LPELRPYQEETIRSKLRKEFYPFTNYQLKELATQIDMYIQLLYQVLLFDESQNGNKSGGCGPQRKAASTYRTMLDLKHLKTPQ